MRRIQRRGYSLISLLWMLPTIAAMSVVTAQLVSKIVRFEGVVCRQVEKDATMRDLVRRIQEDTATAETASVSEEGNQLRLVRSGGEVTYASTGEGVTRTAHQGDQTQVYEWEQNKVTSSFNVETIADRPAVVWITFTHVLSEQRGQDRVRSLSAAAVMGRGGEK